MAFKQGATTRFSDRHIGLRRNFSYAMPAITMAMLHAPITVVLGVYAKHYGISLTSLAYVILSVRIFDAVTDPLIGFFADRSRSRTGSRKTFIFVGGLLMVLSGYFLYVPFNTSATYFCICLFSFY